MAKFPVFKRTSKQVQLLDSVAGSLTDMGAPILLADNSNAFPNRSENLLAVFLGEAYMLYKTTLNDVRLSKYDSGTATWADVAGFTGVSGGLGTVTPTCLHVVKNRLVAACQVAGNAPSDRLVVRRSDPADASTWASTQNLLTPVQPTVSLAGPSVVWKNALWIATASGLAYYAPDTDTLCAAFDAGDDVQILGEKATFGSFSFWDGDLFYVLAPDTPSVAPVLYKLHESWTVSSPVAVPAWINQFAAIPGVGPVAISNDSGNYALFVNKVGILSLLYSGSDGSKLVTIERVGAAWVVTDITATKLPVNYSAEPNLGFSFIPDDRRRSNEQPYILIRYRPAVPVSVIVATWDGVNELTRLSTLDDGGSGLDLMVPDDERGDFRVWTNYQPVCHIDAFSDVFPGRHRIDYTVRDSGSRPIDAFGEYSTDGQTWLPMTEGDGDSGSTNLPTTPSGTSYFFHWDAFADLDGNYDGLDIRMVTRIVGV